MLFYSSFLKWYREQLKKKKNLGLLARQGFSHWCVKFINQLQ